MFTKTYWKNHWKSWVIGVLILTVIVLIFVLLGSGISTHPSKQSKPPAKAGAVDVLKKLQKIPAQRDSKNAVSLKVFYTETPPTTFHQDLKSDDGKPGMSTDYSGIGPLPSEVTSATTRPSGWDTVVFNRYPLSVTSSTPTTSPSTHPTK